MTEWDGELISEDDHEHMMAFINKQQILIAQASCCHRVRPFLVCKLGYLQQINSVEPLGKAEELASRLEKVADLDITLPKLADMLLRQSFVRGNQQYPFQFLLFILPFCIMAVLEQVDMHQQSLAAAGRIL